MNLTATNFRTCVVILAVVNIVVFYLSLQQTTNWTGNITSKGFNTSTATTQYKDELSIIVTRYSCDLCKKKDTTQKVVTTYELIDANSSLLINESNLRTDYHQYFGLDDTCSLVIRRPHPDNVHDLTLVCLH